MPNVITTGEMQMKTRAEWLKARTKTVRRGTGGLSGGPNPTSGIYLPWHPEQVTSLPCASVSSSRKWGACKGSMIRCHNDTVGVATFIMIIFGSVIVTL